MIGGGPNLHVAVALALGRPTSVRDDDLITEVARRLDRAAPPRGPLHGRLAAVLDRPRTDTVARLVNELHRVLACPTSAAPPALFDLQAAS